MPAPRMMALHTLEALKGWPSQAALDFVAVFNPTDLAALGASGDIPAGVAVPGRVVHLHSDGTLKYGIANRQMALFLREASDDPDVSNYGGTAAGNWVAVRPSGKNSCLVATGGYELATTEFDTNQTYALNDTLTAPTGTTTATSGKLTNQSAVPYTNPVCGVVSRAVAINSHGVSELSFWPVYLPVP